MTRPGPEVADVIVVGFGPVGKVLTILLAQLGHQVIAVEKYATPYALPRAVHFDDETARILAEAGVGDRLDEVGEPGTQYDWQNAAGDTLLHFDQAAAGVSGWPQATMFNQPALEAVLAARAARLPSLHLHRRLVVRGVTDVGEAARVDASGPDGERSFQAPWVIGCDGANSVVREQMGVAVHDEGLAHDWLICDVVLHEPRRFEPSNLQICDPRRPTTQVSGGPGRRRWEFMRMPGETVEQLVDPKVVWNLLKQFGVTSDNATLERAVVYTFGARWAEQWRSGRTLIAGDAAHLMPPFAGQGMCSGLRDAHNLAWKLDLVLTGRATEHLLDTYFVERSAHVRHAMGLSMELGRVICLLDESAAAARDAAMMSVGGDPAEALPPLPPPLLSAGLVSHGGGGLMPQGTAFADGFAGPFDDRIGTGWFLLVADADPLEFGDRRSRFLSSVGIRVLAVGDFDVDGFYADVLRDLAATAVLVRPDNWIYGTAATPAKTLDLIDALCAALTTDPQPARMHASAGS